jgi:hypothetical protein
VVRAVTIAMQQLSKQTLNNGPTLFPWGLCRGVILKTIGATFQFVGGDRHGKFLAGARHGKFSAGDRRGYFAGGDRHGKFSAGDSHGKFSAGDRRGYLAGGDRHGKFACEEELQTI